MILNQDPFVVFIKEKIIPNSIIDDMTGIPEKDFIKSLGMNPNGGSDLTNIRTSSTYFTKNKFIHLTELVLDYLDKQFNHVYDIKKAESWQLTQYAPEQFYRPHFDFFHNEEQLKGKSNRIGTFIFYLNDDFTGGETFFPKLNIKVTPCCGTGLYFTYPVDNPKKVLTAHSGEPVISGIKKIATLWLR
jgi:prolyl 4-hydroxylase